LSSKITGALIAAHGAAIPDRDRPAGSGSTSGRVIDGLRRTVLKVIFPFRPHLPANAVTAQDAVTSFLGTMAATAGRTSPLWRKHLEDALADTSLGYDERRAFFDTYPVEDYYFAGVVALEAAKLRQVYGPQDSDALLAEIGDQVDRAAARGDRVISDMVFDIIGRIEMATGPTQQKMPYDKVTKAILRHLDLHKTEATRDLMTDKALRHALGEPLAIGIQNWWQAFRGKFVLYLPPEPEPEVPEEAFAPPVPERPRRPRRRLRRAAALM
jgi:hypothetical protein